MAAAGLTVIDNIKTEIVNPVIYLFLALGLLYFLYGVIKFLVNFDQQTAREEGKKHMIWGVVGLTIMVSVYGLLNLISSTVEVLGQ